MDDDLDARSAALTAAPLGCAFLAWAERLGLNAETAATPPASFHLLAEAVIEVSVWWANHAGRVRDVLAEGPRLRPLARAILGQPVARWWFGPLDRRAQLLAAVPTDAAPGVTMNATEAPSVIVTPDGPPTDWERYAQKPAWGVYTSTEVDGLSSFLVGAAGTAGDLGPIDLPFARVRLSTPSHARVFTVDGPAAWHRLGTAYPAHEAGGLFGGLVAPDFGAVARDWDAVHVTFGGLLTADQVPIEGPDGRTALQGWDAEQTVWLRRVFDEVSRLPDLAEPLPRLGALR